MSKPKILVQLDPDDQCSVFDAVVAVDAGVDQLFRHSSVTPERIQDLVHGCMFTRGPQDLHQTAIFIGGSNVELGERCLQAVTSCFFGPMRVSVMLDANGANTTAAAAVIAAARHLDLSRSTVTVLAATGPVGQRVVRLLAGQGASVRVGSRTLARAQGACEAVQAALPTADLTPVAPDGPLDLAAALADSQAVICAGAAGIELLSLDLRRGSTALQVAIDLNAVPPLGIAGVEVTDRAAERQGQLCYGAIGVGGTKMKIHKAALRQLFVRNDQVLDAEQIFAIGQQLETG